MDLHGLIEKVGALGKELEHEITTDARRAWQLLQAELEKLRPHAHPETGFICIAPKPLTDGLPAQEGPGDPGAAGETSAAAE